MPNSIVGLGENIALLIVYLITHFSPISSHIVQFQLFEYIIQYSPLLDSRIINTLEYMTAVTDSKRRLFAHSHFPTSVPLSMVRSFPVWKSVYTMLRAMPSRPASPIRRRLSSVWGIVGGGLSGVKLVMRDAEETLEYHLVSGASLSSYSTSRPQSA